MSEPPERWEPQLLIREDLIITNTLWGEREWALKGLGVDLSNSPHPDGAGHGNFV